MSWTERDTLPETWSARSALPETWSGRSAESEVWFPHIEDDLAFLIAADGAYIMVGARFLVRADG